MNVRPRIVALFLLVLTFVSCNAPVDLYVGPYRLVTTKPDAKNLVGRWIIDSTTVKDLQTNGYKLSEPTTIVLHPDETFSLINMPDLYKSSADTNHQFVSLAGKWSLQNEYGHWSVALSASERTPRLELWEPRYNSEPKYQLRVLIGDPDSRHFIVFEKR